MKVGLVAVLASALLCLPPSSLAATPTSQSQRGAAERIANHVRTLASDAFEGRLPGSEGERKTIGYISAEMARIGLLPGGEIANGKRSWFQTVPFLNIATVGPVSTRIEGPKGLGNLEQGGEIILRGSSVSPESIDVKNAPIVFIGYGINAPDKNWDDYKGIDLRGKVVIYLFGDPESATGGKPMGRFGGTSHKMGEALKRGAIAGLMVHEADVMGYGWGTIVNAVNQVRQEIVRPDAAQRDLPVEGYISREGVTRLFAAAGLDFATFKKQAQTHSFRPVELAGMTFSTRFGVRQTKVESRTVIGIIPGRKFPEETVTYIAHWDHQGMGPPDAHGDRIYNGALDNASGVASMLEVGRNLARRPRPDRSILFIAVTLEEPGIIGSEYYAQHPLYPLEKTVGVIAFDGMWALGKARDFTNHAPNETELNDLLIEAGKRQGRVFSPNMHPNLFLRMRTDHAPFVRRGVPSIFFGPGEDLLQGGMKTADAKIRDYFANHYHKQSDEYAKDWDYSGVAQDTELTADLGYRLATSRVWPEWKDGGEFKAERDASADRRR